MKIKLVKLDSCDEAVGLELGSEYEAHIADHGHGSRFYIIQAPRQPDYYLAMNQAVRISEEVAQ